MVTEMSQARGSAVGWIAVLVGCAIVAATALAATGTDDFGVWLEVGLTDTSNGRFPQDSLATVNASVTDASSSLTSVDFSGTTSTLTVSRTAHPTILLDYPTTALAFRAAGSGWACNTGAAAGEETCSSPTGSLTVGQTNVLPATFSVIGGPGAPAAVTATVSGGDPFTEINRNTNSTAVDSASVVNPTTLNEGGVPPGSFPHEVGVDQVVHAGAQSFTFSDATANATVTLPPGALPPGTHLSLYRANSAQWSTRAASANQRFVDGYAVGWGNSTATSENASSPITLKVSDSHVASTDTLHRAISTGIGSRTGTALPHGWSVSFTDDPGFVLLHKPGVPVLEITSLTVKRAKHRRLVIHARTKNVGHLAAPRTVTAFYLRSTARPHHSRRVASRDVARLAPGASAAQHAKVGIPRKLAAGKYRVAACADATGKIKHQPTPKCRLSALVVTVHKRSGAHAYISFSSSSPPSASRYILVASPAAHPRMTSILLLLAGVISILAGITTIGLRRRPSRPALT